MLKQSPKELTMYSDYKYLVYVRVSSEKDSQNDSVENQIDICRYWLEQNNYEWNEQSVLKDRESGSLFLERTSMQMILQKARNREIQMVLFKSIHRLARDLKDALEIKEVLLGHGVRVVTIEENYDSLVEGKNDMKFEMYSMFAAQYPKTLSVSVSSALAAKVRRGEHIGRIPYGYDRIDQKLVIKDEEAQVIKQIYDWYTKDGLGFKNITNLLNEGVEKGTLLPPKRGGNWQVTTVQRIIRNPVFCGTFILNRYSSIKVDGRKKQIQNPEEKWVIFENQHPAIVSKKQWEKANNKPVLNRKRKISPWNEFRGGLLKCGECGSNMIIMQSWRKKVDGTKTRWRYLKCSAYRRAGNSGCVNHVPITYEDMREFILDQLIAKNKDVELNFDSMYGNQKLLQIETLKRNLQDYQTKSKGLVDLFLDKLIDKAEFQVRRMEFEQKITETENQLQLLEHEKTNRIAIRNIQQAFKTIANREQDLHHALKVIIDEVIVFQDGTTDIKLNFDL